MDILHDRFPYHVGYEAGTSQGYSGGDGPTFDDVVDDDYQKYDMLLVEAQTSLYLGSTMTVLGAILLAMRMKVENR